MKSFRSYITENVLPTVQVADGGMDIEKPAVRAAINAALTGVTSAPAVTPYVVYNRISKLLAQYHIVLPRKFLEGDKGVEVFEVRQFGHKMGMTDSGEFINQVPSTHYLFLQYGIISPMGVTYAKPTVGGMYRVTARLVDRVELDRLLDIAEITMSEEAECRQMAAKAHAPKEELKDVDDSTEGTEKAADTTQRKSDKKLSADKLDEVSIGTLVRYKNKAGEGREKGVELADKKMKGKAKVGASAPKHPYMEETVEEARMSDRFVANVKKGDEKTMGAIKNAVSGYNKAKGTSHRIDSAGRLGKDNPNASKYGDKRKGKLGRSKIRQGDAASSDVYVRPRERDYSKPDFGYKDDNEHTRKIKLGIANKLKKKHVKEETVEEGRMPPSVIKHKQKLAGMTDAEKKAKFAGKSEAELKAMAWRHGYGKDSNVYSKHGTVKEEKGDRLTPGFNRKDFNTVANEIGTGKGGLTIVGKAPEGGESKQQTIYPMSPKSTSRVAPDDVAKKLDTSTPGNPQAERNRDLNEKAPPDAKYERMVKHIKKGYSKDGLTAKEKSIAYATAWKAKKHQKEETKFDPSTEIPRN